MKVCLARSETDKGGKATEIGKPRLSRRSCYRIGGSSVVSQFRWLSHLCRSQEQANKLSKLLPEYHVNEHCDNITNRLAC